MTAMKTMLLLLLLEFRRGFSLRKKNRGFAQGGPSFSGAGEGPASAGPHRQYQLPLIGGKGSVMLGENTALGREATLSSELTTIDPAGLRRDSVFPMPD